MDVGRNFGREQRTSAGPWKIILGLCEGGSVGTDRRHQRRPARELAGQTGPAARLSYERRRVAHRQLRGDPAKNGRAQLGVASVSVCGRKSADGGSFFQSAGSGVAPQRVRAGLSTAFKAFYQGFEGLSVVPGEPRGGVLGDRRGVLLQGHEVVEGVGAVELRGMDQAHLDVAHPGSHQRFIGQ